MALAELAAPNLEGRSYTQWMGRLDSEDLNLRAAFNYALATPEGADRVLEQFWSMRRYWREARQPAQALAILEQALDRVGPDITPTRLSQALYCKCLLVNHVDRRVALEAISNALPLARQAGNRSLEAEVQSRYSRSLSDNGNDQAALESGAEAVALARQIDDPVLLGMALFQFASVLDQAGDAGAEVVYLEGLALVEHSEDHQTERHLRNNYALVLIGQGNLSDARRHLKEALNLAGNELGALTMTMYNNLGWVLLQEGDAQRSASYQSDVLRSARLTGITWMVPYTVLGLACCATQLDHAERAARLHGGADALLLASSNQWESLEGRIRERDITVLREGLGKDFERLYAEGAAMSHDEVIKLALSGN
jgi:tetratricopeptide (TPR) repeat protein